MSTSAPPFKRPRIGDVVTSKAQDTREAPKKPVAKGIRGKRSNGKLSKIVNLPLDVIFEIVARLEPLDLLYLSRVSKSFRSLLNPNVNGQLWSAARSNITDLPACPKDLNEAQYAALLFEHRCQACGSACKADSVEFAIRCRLCQACHKELMVKGKTIVQGVYEHMTDMGLEAYYLDYEELVKICKMLPRSIQRYNGLVHDSPRSFGENGLTSDFFKPELDAISKKYLELKDDEERLGAFIAERQANAEVMNESGFEIQHWASQHARGQRADKATKIAERSILIKEKLVDSGWNEEDFPQKDTLSECGLYLDWNSHFSQHKQLTERGWKILQTKLVTILDNVKETRRQERMKSCLRDRGRELVDLWPDFIKKHPPQRFDHFTLPVTEVKHLPSVSEILSQHEAQLTVTVERLSFKAKAILSEYSERIDNLKERLASIVPTEKPADSAIENRLDDTLQHSSALFACACGANYLMTAQQVFKHSHINVAQEWSVTNFYCPNSAVKIGKSILKAIGAVEESTLETLSEFDNRLQCLCDHPNAAGLSLGYFSLVNHFWQENIWFATARKNWRSDCPGNLLNDHSLSRIEDLVDLHDSELTSTPPLKISLDEDQVCETCYRGGIEFGFSTINMRDYHLLAKHGEEVYIEEPDDSEDEEVVALVVVAAVAAIMGGVCAVMAARRRMIQSRRR